eukprot:m.560130 g.560130  ORF g.560130 m.560130 type:complete len:206 (-) comp57785_c0_seq17:216-833(-)
MDTHAHDASKGREFLFKVVLIGDSGVGKSSLLFRLVSGDFGDAYRATIGVDFKIRTINSDGALVTLQIWDTAGQERFRSLVSSYFRDAHGIILVFDTTNLRSFWNLQVWLDQVERFAPANVCKLILGNKSDCLHARQVEKKAAEAFSATTGIPFLEVSALDASNIELSFAMIATAMKQRADPNLKEHGHALKLEHAPPPPSSCCS